VLPGVRPRRRPTKGHNRRRHNSDERATAELRGLKHAHMLAELAIQGREVFAKTAETEWRSGGVSWNCGALASTVAQKPGNTSRSQIWG
jgi:hypothetical protein